MDHEFDRYLALERQGRVKLHPPGGLSPPDFPNRSALLAEYEPAAAAAAAARLAKSKAGKAGTNAAAPRQAKYSGRRGSYVSPPVRTASMLSAVWGRVQRSTTTSKPVRRAGGS